MDYKNINIITEGEFLTVKRVIFLFIILLSVLCIKVSAQTNFWDGPEAFPGQTRPSDTPKIFAPAMLAPGTSAFALDRVAFSPDGKEFYYCTNKAWFDGKNLKKKVFKYDGKKWNGPFLLNEHFYTPTFSING
jgi:hypothetical protein